MQQCDLDGKTALDLALEEDIFTGDNMTKEVIFRLFIVMFQEVYGEYHNFFDIDILVCVALFLFRLLPQTFFTYFLLNFLPYFLSLSLSPFLSLTLPFPLSLRTLPFYSFSPLPPSLPFHSVLHRLYSPSTSPPR